jgi:ABC-type branched-subunit amino acid transport system ATPase component
MPFRCPAGRAECSHGAVVADYGYVLETGRIVLGGKPDEVWGN